MFHRSNDKPRAGVADAGHSLRNVTLVNFRLTKASAHDRSVVAFYLGGSGFAEPNQLAIALLVTGSG
jgi:hypothetical protein